MHFYAGNKIASPGYGSNHTHSDAHSRPALNSWSERTTLLKPLFHGLTVLRHCPRKGSIAMQGIVFTMLNAASPLFLSMHLAACVFWHSTCVTK